jgi:hypothetical protein
MTAGLVSLRAEEQPATPPPPEQPAGAPSAEDLADIQRALGADAQTKTAPVAPPAPVVTGARSGVSFNPDLSFIADFALAAFSDDNQQRGGHDPAENGFNLQALEMAASADVDPYFKFNTNIVFAQDGVEVEEAYATTTALPASLQLRAGQFLTRFGRINPTHPHTWDFVDQPFVISKMLGPDGNRGLGAEISWLSPLPWYLELVLSQTMAVGECCARSFYADMNQGVRGPQDLETMFAIKQFFALSDDWSLATGLSAALGPNPTSRSAETYIFGGDLYLKYRPISHESTTIVSLQAEALTRRRDSPAGVLADSGLYAQVLWRFAQRWTTAARFDFGTGVHDDPLDPDWVGNRYRVSADVTFYPTEFSRLRLQGSRDTPTYLDDSIYAAFLALEVAVGAHGAHAF